MENEQKNILMCEYCCGEITSKADLVVAFYFFTLSAYHSECYGKEAKNSFFLSRTPINGNVSNIITIISSLWSIMVFIVSPVYETKILSSIVAIILLLIRIYSWYKYESILD